ncbi:CYP704B1, partial [Symbiodinium necroappetens]
MLNASDTPKHCYGYLQALCKDLSRDDFETGAWPQAVHEMIVFRHELERRTAGFQWLEGAELEETNGWASSAQARDDRQAGCRLRAAACDTVRAALKAHRDSTEEGWSDSAAPCTPGQSMMACAGMHLQAGRGTKESGRGCRLILPGSSFTAAALRDVSDLQRLCKRCESAFPCAQCGQMLPASGFAAEQSFKPMKARCCSNCVMETKVPVTPGDVQALSRSGARNEIRRWQLNLQRLLQAFPVEVAPQVQAFIGLPQKRLLWSMGSRLLCLRCDRIWCGGAVIDCCCWEGSMSRPAAPRWRRSKGGSTALELERLVTEPITGRDPQGVHPSAASPIRITMPAMLTHSSKVVLHEDPLPQRLLMLEQKCRAQEAMLLEKDAHLQKLKENADGEQLRQRVLMPGWRDDAALTRHFGSVVVQSPGQPSSEGHQSFVASFLGIELFSPECHCSTPSKIWSSPLEQKVRLQEAELHDRDKQIHKLTEIVDQAKSSLQQLAIEADSENNELQAELVAMKGKLECVADETRSREEVDQLDKKLAESEAMCQALRWELDAISVRNAQETATSADPGNDLTDREVTALRAEAVRLRELQQLQWQQHAANAQRFRAELTALRAALRREGLAVDSGVELAADASSEALEEAKMETVLAQKELEESRGLAVQATSEVVKLRDGLSEAEAALETERRTRRQAVESLHQCEEVAAKLMAERNAARAELEEHTAVAEAFRKQAASDVRESRWARFTLRLLHFIDGSTFDELKESWSYGLQRWQ